MRMTLVTLVATALVATLCAIAPIPAQAEDAAKAAPTTAPEAGPAKFYGTVSAVDTKASTFTVDDKVYHVIGETQMTKASDDSKATLEESLVGEAARGTYTKAGDGTLNVTKVRFGKKTGGKGGGKSGGKGGKSGETKGEAATKPEKA